MTVSEPLISSIVVKGLFDQYDYELPTPPQRLGDAAILYGDNGVGKSTILRLVFEMLSPANNRGHRSALARIPFSSLEIRLGAGVTLKAHRVKRDSDGNPTRRLDLSISRDDELLAVWRYDPDQEKRSLPVSSDIEVFEWRTPITEPSIIVARGQVGNDAYIKTLAKYAPVVFILNAERRLDSDSVHRSTDDFENIFSSLQGGKRLYDLVAHAREIALSQALTNAANSISQKAFLGANQGSTNVHAVYVNLLKHLLATRNIPQERLASRDKLLTRLSEVESTALKYSIYNLSTPLDISVFKNALVDPSLVKEDLITNLVEPYVASLESRHAAIAQIFLTIDRFISILNSFFSGKSIAYDTSRGFVIRNERTGRELNAGMLSSGEQQLLLLFCYVLISTDQPSVFIIDEPEISLNIKWQRKLVQSLLDVAQGGNVQFVLASHSIELLAQHRHRVVRLGERSSHE